MKYLISLISIPLSYLIIAYINWEWNPACFTEGMRVGQIWINIIIAIPVIIYLLDKDININVESDRPDKDD